MRGLPMWIIGLVAVLAALLIVLGWHDRDEAGYIPIVMGCLFALFTLASLGLKARGDS